MKDDKTKQKTVRKRVNIKDLHELPARFELVSSNMTLVALLSKKEAEKSKIFKDAQAQIAKLKATNQELVLEEARGAEEMAEASENYVCALNASQALYSDAKTKGARLEKESKKFDVLAETLVIVEVDLKEANDFNEILKIDLQAHEVSLKSSRNSVAMLEEQLEEASDKADLNMAIKMDLRHSEESLKASRNEVKCLKADHMSLTKTCASIRIHYIAKEHDLKYTLSNAQRQITEYEQTMNDWHRMMAAFAIVAILIVCAGVILT
jgi:hypothetical protein